MNSILKFNTEPFIFALKAFFRDLKVPVNYITDHPDSVQNILTKTFEDNESFNLIDEVYPFGIVDDAAFEGEKSIAVSTIKSDYDGILIFGVTLKSRGAGILPTRGQLADISRAFNREFHYTPVIVVFKYNGYIAFSNTERIEYKQEWKEGEKAGKVTILRDVNIENPHRGHIDILTAMKIRTSGTNAVGSFNALYRYWQEVFNVNILNKKFYKELQNWYFWAVKEVTFPNTPNQSNFDTDEKFELAVKEHKSKNVIRLLTRILFIWFIKEKKLIPEELFDEKCIAEKLINDFTPQKLYGIIATGNQNSQYYRAILQNLFFATLNKEMKKRKFRIDGQNQNVTNLMRYRNYFKNPDYFLQLMEEVVPFMNGGLFECLDKPHPTLKGKQGGEVIIYNDGFSDRDDNLLVIPDYLFFDVDEVIDLSDDFGSTDKVYKNAKTRGLIEILKSYKFTITENTPIEEDVALDPELLGKVFENLLASYNPETKTTARKQTGSFYTPREIVNYMVDESLIAYLKNTLLGETEGVVPIGQSQIEMFGNDTRKGQLCMEQKIDINKWKTNVDGLETKLRLLLSYNNVENPFSTEDTVLLIKSIDNCKILDPACGSGAFPMGVLQKLVHILQKLDKDNQHWRELQIQKAIAETEEAFKIGEKVERQNRLLDINETFDCNASDYGRKLFLIENCIYGLDIQPIAVQIAKLRFFISLVCDQKTNPNRDNFGIRPLPNLETKFVAANTLISLKTENTVKPDKVYGLEKKLIETRHKHFSALTPETKRKYRQQDKELRKLISDELITSGFPPTTAELVANWDPYDQNTHAEWFDNYWMFSISDGFNIVIGNPPYLRIQGVQESTPALIPYAKKYYKSAQNGNWDLYVLFNEAGYNLLKKKGILAFIQPHKFFQGNFGVGLRNYIAKEKCLYQIVHFGAEQMFESATNYTCLFFLQKQAQKKFKYIKVDNPDEWLLNTTNAPSFTLPQPEKDQKWVFTSDEKQTILEKLKIQPQTLDNVVRKIFQGIPTGADKVFILLVEKNESGKILKCYSNSLEKGILIEKEFVKPFLLGRDVKRYEKPEVKNVVLFPYKNENGKCALYTESEIKNKFPLAWDYLNKNKDIILKRENNRFEKTWWQFSRPQNLTEFETVKIITPDIANFPKFSLDVNFNYHTTTVYSFSFNKTGVTEKHEYWLGLLNSKLLWFFLQSTGNVLRGSYFRFKTEYLKPFPIKRIDFNKKDECIFYEKIIDLVNIILENKKLGKDTFRLEAEIDAIVFHLYSFTEEEMVKTLLLMPDVSEAERREIQYNFKKYILKYEAG